MERSSDLQVNWTSTWLNQSPGNTSSDAQEYFKQLSNKQVASLIEYYKFDFIAFNYSYETYIH